VWFLPHCDGETTVLTPEERQRIEEEERKRIAEEQYRAEVRARLQQPQPPPVSPSNRLIWALAIGAVLVIGALILFNSSTNRPRTSDDGPPTSRPASASARVPKTRYVPANQKISSGQVVVKARGYVYYRINIQPGMVEPTVKGSFNASGGSGNDIEAVLADEANYTNWINGHQAQAFWGTTGKQTTGSFEVRLRPGTYYLAISNRFSAFTDKQVFLEVDLNYKKAETYY
jgi:hypothetical protein